MTDGTKQTTWEALGAVTVPSEADVSKEWPGRHIGVPDQQFATARRTNILEIRTAIARLAIMSKELPADFDDELPDGMHSVACALLDAHREFEGAPKHYDGNAAVKQQAVQDQMRAQKRAAIRARMNRK